MVKCIVNRKTPSEILREREKETKQSSNIRGQCKLFQIGRVSAGGTKSFDGDFGLDSSK